MNRLLFFLITCILGVSASGQSFSSLKREMKLEVNSQLHNLVIRGKTAELSSLLKKNPSYAKQASTTETEKISSTSIQHQMPLIFDVIQNCFEGNCHADMLDVVIKAGADLYTPYRDSTPIYFVLDKVATTPTAKCAIAEDLLNVMIRNGLDINQKYKEKGASLSYLIRKNSEFLHGKYNDDYLATGIIKLLIENGADINSYDKDGSTLLAFLANKNDDSLTDYFIRKGIDVTHKDKAGYSDFDKALLTGNLAFAKKALEEKLILLDVNSLNVKPNDISSSDVYNLIAQHCASKATQSDDVIKVYTLFEKRRDLIQTKYENWARTECENNKDFRNFSNIESKYVGAKELVEKYRRKYYDRIFEEVKTNHNRVMQFISEDRYASNIKNTSEVYSILNEKYDPSGMEKLAKDVDEYSILVEGYIYTPEYASYNANFPPKFNEGGSLQPLQRALRDYKTENAVFAQFIAKTTSLVSDKYNRVQAKNSEARDGYRYAVNKYKAWREEELQKIRRLTITEMTSRITDEGNWSRGRFRDTDDDHADHKTVKFKDDIWVEMTEVVSDNKKWFWASGYDDEYSSESTCLYETYKKEAEKKFNNKYPAIF